MRVISVPGVDITSLIENARNSVKGKAPVEALKAFTELHSVVNAKELCENAITHLHMYPLQSCFRQRFWDAMAAPLQNGLEWEAAPHYLMMRC